MTHKAFRHLEQLLEKPIATRAWLVSEKTPTSTKVFSLSSDYVSTYIERPKNYSQLDRNRKNM